MTTAIYARVAQNNNPSALQLQIEKIKDSLSDSDLDIKIYRDITSGLMPIEERESGAELFKDVENELITKLIVTNVDRISRNINEFIVFKLMLEECNVELKILNPTH